MSIEIKELKGMNLKKDVGLCRVVKRWHNHNKTGGNFGINLYPSEPREYSRRAYEITGEHDTEGLVRSLRFGNLYQVGTQIFGNDAFMSWDYARLVAFIKARIEEEEKKE